MTHAEILERVKKKSTICPKCGCFVSSLLDCCPACGYKESNSTNSNTNAYLELISTANSLLYAQEEELQTLRELTDYYKSSGGNGATAHILKQTQTAYDNYLSSMKYNSNIDKPKRFISVSSVNQLYNMQGQNGQIVYVYDIKQIYIWRDQWVSVTAPCEQLASLNKQVENILENLKQEI